MMMNYFCNTVFLLVNSKCGGAQNSSCQIIFLLISILYDQEQNNSESIFNCEADPSFCCLIMQYAAFIAFYRVSQ